MQNSYKVSIVFLVFCCFFWVFSVSFHDWFDPSINLEFMRYVLKGSNKATSSLHIMDLAFTRIIFYLVVVFESVIALIFMFSFISMINGFNNKEKFKSAKMFAVYGLLLCILKYFVLFVCISAEWFYMWETAPMTQVKASIFTGLMVVILIFLKVVDNE